MAIVPAQDGGAGHAVRPTGRWGRPFLGGAPSLEDNHSDEMTNGRLWKTTMLATKMAKGPHPD
jgi:hypothetical protein